VRERAAAGGEQDFEGFVRQASPALLRYAMVLTLDAHRAEDLAQETFVRIGTAWSRRGWADDPVAYARRTMTNVFLNERRRARREVLRPLPDGPDATRSATAEVDDRSALRTLLAALPPRQRAAVALRYVLDQSDDDIAAVLGCSPQTVRSQISRGLATLRLAHAPRQET
jgi:RNA polymerase sigma-70 factor (sigma-E family)